MNAGLEALPDDIDALKAALIVARAEAAAARARQSDDQALIAHLKLQIEKLNRDRYGPRSERTARLLDQLALTLEELESSATQDELDAEMAAAKTTKVASFTRKRPSGPAGGGVLLLVHLANYSGIFQADAYGGYGRRYEPGRNAGPILEAACWVHARRPFFVMADLAENARRKAQGKKPAVISPLALETVRRIDAVFEIERTIVFLR